MKKIIEKILHPPVIALLIIVIVAAVGLIVAFQPQFDNTPIQYIGYLFSAYALTVLVINFRRVISVPAEKFAGSALVSKIRQTRIGRYIIGDLSDRGKLSIYQGLAANIIYAAFRAITALIYHSIWFGVVAIYYILLSAVRVVLAAGVRHSEKHPGSALQKEIFELKMYRICGILMLFLNIGMTGVVVMMVKNNMYYEYPGYIIFASAAYTFYITITAIINIVKFRKLKSPILSASKAISLTAALMSMLALQTSMIARFGSDDTVFRYTMNTITGAVVCSGTVLMAVFIIINGSRKLSIKKSQNP